MAKPLDIYDAEEQRFMNDLIALYADEVPNAHPNRDALILFLAIQRLFARCQGKPMALGDPYLVHHLAACAWVAMAYDTDARIPWDGPDRDHIITKTLRGFMTTVAQAIRDGKIVRASDGRVSIGACTIPEWYVTQIEHEHKKHEAWRRSMQDAFKNDP